ncbi:MAG: alpha-amylase family glycosyl hydrolase [Candidatus Electrothrix aestuarii]|uniref:Alpha-dextrin endo-1,6-alpha-glucosidase n=1 Tax=Candidatus Electrothrix aestuarii TaxID=3062594 RepID=A0AAU8LPI5_9BACT|nr:alpha-amylase family glycosyl hydrolase [Candidatus Electrothrix aestuarii]
MNTFHILTQQSAPRLWVWRDRKAGDNHELAYNAQDKGKGNNGFRVFTTNLDHQIHQPAHLRLYTGDWAWKDHPKNIPRTKEFRFPENLWMSEDAARVVSENPFTGDAVQKVTIHLITAKKYRDGQLYFWLPGKEGRTVQATGEDNFGPFYEVELQEDEQHMFLFKFIDRQGHYEPDYANRLWVAQDGNEIWVHSQASAISSEEPKKKPLIIHARQFNISAPLHIHLWQEDSDFATTLANGIVDAKGWVRFEYPVYTGRPYRFMFYNPDLERAWENKEARRTVLLTEDGTAWAIHGDGSTSELGLEGVWALEGDNALYGNLPRREKEISLEVVDKAPDMPQEEPLTLEVWINRARAPLYTGLQADEDGYFRFSIYPGTVTSFRFSAGEQVEPIERHFLKAKDNSTHRYVVLGRADVLPVRPQSDLFLDPPFTIERPGVWVDDDQVRFAVHCPSAACLEVIGEWTNWEQEPLPMRSTRDGAYWWAEISRDELTNGDTRPLHGMLYKFRLNQIYNVQDPAADWVENSDPERASKLVDHQLFSWTSDTWQRPGWEYLNIYQLHPSLFSKRAGLSGLDAITRELNDPAGYLRKVKATALLLMPTCEFAGDHSWGYNPSFFYSVESAYGGPDALKRLVDAAHQQGKAVLLDVVFNHASASDNPLWTVAGSSFFDGDTDWGAMLNFDHPQVIHFFERNMAHFMQNYRIDGFRFDFTRVIYMGNQWTYHVRRPGSGGGWEFLQRLRQVAHNIDNRCLLMAENLPNDWNLTHPGGPMDTQWCDDFHDCLVDACRGWDVMGRLANAMKISHTACERWHEATIYAESHDEVGNEPHRISNVAGYGQGMRRSKVAAAATLLGRGVPLSFMGAEVGEWRQFPKDENRALDLDQYEQDTTARHMRNWWNRLAEIRRGNTRLEGPSLLRITFAQEGILAFTRGEGNDLFILLNFSPWAGWRSLNNLNLPDGNYKELLNSTWGAYRVEGEDEHANGGWEAHIYRGDNRHLHIPDYGVVVLERR